MILQDRGREQTSGLEAEPEGRLSATESRLVWGWSIGRQAGTSKRSGRPGRCLLRQAPEGSGGTDAEGNRLGGDDALPNLLLEDSDCVVMTTYIKLSIAAPGVKLGYHGEFVILEHIGE